MPRTAPLQPVAPTLELDVVFPGSGAPYRFRFYGEDGRANVNVHKDLNAPATYSIYEGSCPCPAGQHHGYCKHLDFAKTVWTNFPDVCESAHRFESEFGKPVSIALAPGWQDFYKAERPARVPTPAAPPPPTTEELIAAWEASVMARAPVHHLHANGNALAARLRELSS